MASDLCIVQFDKNGSLTMSSLPILDLRDAFESLLRPRFLKDLRCAVIEIGFFALSNFSCYGPSTQDFDEITAESKKLFNAPESVKQAIEMVNSPHFLGYTRLGNEITAQRCDWREQIDLATELPPPPKDSPLYRQIEGPNLWPDATCLPNFRGTVERYIEKMAKLSEVIRKLLACALGLDANAFEGLFKENQQCKMKLVSYPDISTKPGHEDGSQPYKQGVGPHRDSDFLTFIYQATDHQNSLQVQDFKGEWISVNPVPGTLIVNGGQTLEAVTSGVCKAAIHRVNSPEAGSGTRISIPFFLTIDLDAYKAQIEEIPADVLALRDRRDEQLKKWGTGIGFQFTPELEKEPVGVAVFMNRIKAHQDVAKRWYPDVLEQVLQQY